MDHLSPLSPDGSRAPKTASTRFLKFSRGKLDVIDVMQMSGMPYETYSQLEPSKFNA